MHNTRKNTQGAVFPAHIVIVMQQFSPSVSKILFYILNKKTQSTKSFLSFYLVHFKGRYVVKHLTT